MKDNSVEEAIKMLRERGFRVYPASGDPNKIWILRTPLYNGRYYYGVRLKRNTRGGTFRREQGTEVAQISLKDLKWEKEIF